MRPSRIATNRRSVTRRNGPSPRQSILPDVGSARLSNSVTIPLLSVRAMPIEQDSVTGHVGDDPNVPEADATPRGRPRLLVDSMYRTADKLRAEQATEGEVVPLSQGGILDGCPLVFWADQTGEVAEENSRRRAPPTKDISIA